MSIVRIMRWFRFQGGCSIIVASVCCTLAGCATASRGKKNSASDWNSYQQTNVPVAEFEHVPEGPQIAPPPGSTPDTSKPPVFSRNETWIPIARWSRDNGIGTLQQISPAPGPVYSLKTTNGALIFQAKNLIAKWNGQEFHLGFEPQMIGGQPFVHALDLEKTILPLLRNSEAPAKTNRVVVIDPGHGGQNAGTASVLGNANEKEFTLDWGLRLARLLATNGWHVVLTRTNDVDISLSNRVAIAEQHKADLFISLHFNSVAPNKEQTGLETFCLTPSGMPSTLTREYEDNASLVFTNNSFDAENFLLAMDVHHSLLKQVGMADRGVRHARFLGVLRGQNRPAILIEGGYLSNPNEARRIANASYREKLAEAVAGALIQKSEGRVQKSEAGPLTSETSPTLSPTNSPIQ
jgi:N-acetylmuramoyl-L-alanine amidase